MTSDRPFILAIESYELRHYRSFETAARGVIGWGSGDPNEIKLYVGRDVQVDWAAFDAWRYQYGAKNANAFSKPLPPPVNFSKASETEIAAYRAAIKERNREEKAFTTNLVKLAARDLEGVFLCP